MKPEELAAWLGPGFKVEIDDYDTWEVTRPDGEKVEFRPQAWRDQVWIKVAKV